MKKINDNKSKINLKSGLSSAVGAAGGVVIGSVAAQEVQAQDVIVDPNPPYVTQPETISETETIIESESNSEPTPDPIPEPDPIPDPDPIPSPAPESELEVLAYDRVENVDGTQMDVAVVNVNGESVGIVDMDLDGKADIIMQDVNHNEVIEENEVGIVADMNIEMKPLAEISGFDPLYAQENLPDYVNDADVDSYMA